MQQHAKIVWTEEQLIVIRRLYGAMSLVWRRLFEAGKLTNSEKELHAATMKIMEEIIPMGHGHPWWLSEREQHDEWNDFGRSPSIWKAMQ